MNALTGRIYPRPGKHPDWTRANCRGIAPEIFFPDKGDNKMARLAKSICDKCILRNECRDFAIDNGEPLGIFGGMTRKERLAYARLYTREKS